MSKHPLYPLGVCFRKFTTFLRLCRYGHFGLLASKIPFVRFFLSLTNLLPHPNRYKYLVISSHGVGLTSFVFYLERMGVSPVYILRHEVIVPFVFYSNKMGGGGVVVDKAPTNGVARLVFSTLTSRVPTFIMVRDPISIIKSCVNLIIFHRVDNIHTKQDAYPIFREVVHSWRHLMFDQRTLQEQLSNAIGDVFYIQTSDIMGARTRDTISTVSDIIGLGKLDIPSLDSEGTLFSRAFPYVFGFNGRKYAISSLDRLSIGLANSMNFDIMMYDKSRLRNSTLHDKPDGFREFVSYSVKNGTSPKVIVDDILVECFGKFRLCLVCDDDNPETDRALDIAMNYVEIVRFNINKILQSIKFDEEAVIDFLLRDLELCNEICRLIDHELLLLKQQRPDIYDGFSHFSRLKELMHKEATTVLH